MAGRRVFSRVMGGLALGVMAVAAAQSANATEMSEYSQLAKLPDFSGVWTQDSAALGAARAPRQPVNMKLTPAAQAKYDAFLAKQAAEGVQQDAQIRCIPPGMPRIMRQPYPLEFLFTPNRITVLTETYSQARRIYMDGRALPEDPENLFNGTSVGRWVGQELIVDTVGFSPLVHYVDGLPHGEQMRVRERMWLVGPGQMRIETTITDPGVLVEPLVILAAYKRQPTWEMREYICEENNRLTSTEGGVNIDLKLDEEDPFAGF
jgi:hypothetical protein